MSDWVIFIDKKFNSDDESLHGHYFVGYKEGLPLFEKSHVNAVKLVGEDNDEENLYSVIMNLYNKFGIKGIPRNMSGNRIYDEEWAKSRHPQPKCKFCGVTSFFVLFDPPHPSKSNFVCESCRRSENRNDQIDALLCKNKT